MSGEGGGSYGLGNFMAFLFGVPCLLLVWSGYQALRHPPVPTIGTPYEQNAVPMSWTDDCGDEPVCVWYWLYDGVGMALHFGPDFPPGAEPVRSLPVLAVGP